MTSRNRSRNRYIQIALTYTQPLPLRLWALCTAAFITWMCCIREANYAVQLCILLLGGTLVAWIAAMVPAHAKEQIADARSSLTPHYRAPHLIVAAAVFITIVTALTAFTIWRFHHLPREVGWINIPLTTVGFFATALMWSAALAWVSHRQSLGLITAVVCAGVLVATPLGAEFRAAVIANRYPALTIGLLVASILAFAGLWWRLAVLHEEMPEYFRLEQLNTRLRVQMTGDRFFRRAAAAQTGAMTDWMCHTAVLDRVGNVFDASLWRRVQHWRLVIGVGRVSMLAPLMVALTVLGAAVFDADGRTTSDDDFLLHFPLVLGLLMPIIVAGINLPRRWYMLGIESLRPVSRAQMLREHGGAVATELAITFAWTVAGSYLPAMIFKPALLLTYNFVTSVALMAAAQVWFFGVAMWVLRWRGSLTWMGVVFGGLWLGTLALVAKQFQPGPRIDLARGPSPLFALALVIAGLIVLYDAYRRWLVTDLD